MADMTATEFAERRDRNNRRFSEAVNGSAYVPPSPRDIEAISLVVQEILNEEMPELFPPGDDKFDTLTARLKELWAFANAKNRMKEAAFLIDGDTIGRVPMTLRGVRLDNFVMIDGLEIRKMSNMEADRIFRPEAVESPFHERINCKPWEKTDGKSR